MKESSCDERTDAYLLPFLHSSQWLVTAAVLIYFRNVFKGDNGLGADFQKEDSST